MTTIYKKAQKTVEHEECVSCVCDWCQESMPKNYGRGNCKTREFEFTTGYSYPDDCGESGWSIEDLCDECVEKLRALLEHAGITIREIDY